MANPYHDAEGKFCSKSQMREAYEKLGSEGKLEDYFKLRTEYEALVKENAPFEITSPSRRKKQLAPITVTPSILKPPKAYVSVPHPDLDYSGYEPVIDPNGIPRVKSVLARYFQCGENELPQELIEYAEDDLKLNTLEGWEVTKDPDYYGGYEYTGSIESDAKERLDRWYYDQPNATDEFGVLEYVRSKGVDTSGKNPVKALQAQLRAEHGEMEAVTKSVKVSSERLRFSQLAIVDVERYDKALKAEIVSANGIADRFAGVVVQQGRGNYYLVDGYKRVKGMTKGNNLHRFIVLHRW